jgi:uncharacterized membrane protein
VRALPAIFALIVGAVGWYYLFYSRSASGLSAIEAGPQNRLRSVLRRVNAIVMLLIAAGIAVAFTWYDRSGQERQFVLMSMAILLLLVVLVVLGLIDLRLTWKLRQQLRERKRR